MPAVAHRNSVRGAALARVLAIWRHGRVRVDRADGFVCAIHCAARRVSQKIVSMLMA
jgi:hypothetical protein